MEMTFRYTQEMIDYVREIAPGRFNKEIAELFNERFGLNKTVKQISSLKKNHKIRSEVKGALIGRKRLFSEEEENFIKENVKGRYNKELTEMLNRKFKTNYTVEQVSALKNRRKWTSGLTGRFKKGQKPWNKGKKGLYFTGSEKGWFKKGQKATNHRPVGSERISKDGYIVVKVQEKGKYQERRRNKHVVEWEKHHGPIPKNHVVVFLDSDKTNVSIDNLKMIHRRTLSYVNKNGGLSTDRNESLARIKLAELDSKIGKLSVTKNDEEKYIKYLKIAEKNGIQKETFKSRLRKGWSFKESAYTPLNQRPKGR